MDEYINRQDALADLDDIGFFDDEPIQTRNRALKIIRNITAADVAPVVHGKWTEEDIGDGDMIYICSACGETWLLNSGTPKDNNMNYCPMCGAKMDL